MPYKIRKIGKPPKEWCVVNTVTNDNKGCSETKEKAKKHLAVLNMREHGVPEKKEAKVTEVIESTEATESPQIALPAEYIERLKTFEQAAVAFLGDKAPTPPPLPAIAAEEKETEEIEEMEEVKEEAKAAEDPPKDTVEQYTGGIESITVVYNNSAPEQEVATDEQKEAQPLPSTDPLPVLTPESMPERTSAPIPELTKIEASKLDQIKLWVKSIFDKVCGKDEKENLALPIFITKEQSDGSFRWISISNTAFLDREGEIVSTKGVAESISRADSSGYHGDFRFWHERSIVLGTCDLQSQDGVCLIESGLWADTPLAKSVREGVAASPISWGKSIGFYPLTAPQEDVVIKGATVRRLWTDLQIVERSILPSSEAASLFTQIQTRGLSMEQKKKDALVELLGDEALVEEVLAKAAEINKAASDPSAIVKEADATPPPQEAPKESQPGGEKATQTETVNAEEKEGGDPTSTPETSGNDEELLILVKALGIQIAALETQVKALQESQSAPRMTLHRPILSSQPADDAEIEKAVAGEAPRAVQAMRRQVLGTG